MLTRRGFAWLAAVIPLLGGRRAVGVGAGLPLKELTLYQPEEVVAARISVEALSTFAKAIQVAFHGSSGERGLNDVEGVLVAVAIRPGRRQRVWCETVVPSRPSEDSKLVRRLNQVLAPEVKDLVAFSLTFVREGRDPKMPFIPSSWRKVAGKSGKPILIPDDPMAALWPK